jgi:membrane protein implicated in regulation of membrane protease activity
MLYGASGGLLVLGLVFITREETRWVGIFWLLAAVVLALVGWRKRNRAGKPATSAEDQGPGITGRDSKPTQP